MHVEEDLVSKRLPQHHVTTASKSCDITLNSESLQREVLPTQKDKGDPQSETTPFTQLYIKLQKTISYFTFKALQ